MPPSFRGFTRGNKRKTRRDRPPLARQSMRLEMFFCKRKERIACRQTPLQKFIPQGVEHAPKRGSGLAADANSKE